MKLKLRQRMRSGKIQVKEESKTPIISKDPNTFIYMGKVYHKN